VGKRVACHLHAVWHEDRHETSLLRNDEKGAQAGQTTPNPQSSRPRAAHGKGIVARDATSESEEDESERVEWGTRQYGVRVSPAHPWYVGRGDDTCGGVVYSIQEIKKLLNSQPEDMKQWLTTSQMGWALTREENEVVNEKDGDGWARISPPK